VQGLLAYIGVRLCSNTAALYGPGVSGRVVLYYLSLAMIRSPVCRGEPAYVCPPRWL
jgi:hypothetical protein